MPIEKHDQNKALLQGEPEKRDKLIKPENVEIWRPTKPMSTKEVIEEMKKQGRRPLTLEELQHLQQTETVSRSAPDRIEPRDTDIIVEAEEVKDKNALPGKTESE